MGKINSKAKGARGERYLVKLFKDHGYDCRRTAQFCGNTGEADDITGIEYIHCEMKWVQNLNLDKAMEQAIRDSNASKNQGFPTVFHKKNNREMYVNMRFQDWIQLYDSYYSDQKLKEIDDGKMDDLIDNKIVPEMNENKK